MCSSPRLVVEGRVYLYQGQSEGRPYYTWDQEGRSLPSPPAAAARTKRAAFIGRVDGGGTTTTRRPWNYSAQGGGRGAWGGSSSSRGAQGGSRGPVGGRVSASSIGGRLGPGLPPSPPPASHLYWSPSSRSWLVSPTLGAPEAQATLASQ